MSNNFFTSVHPGSTDADRVHAGDVSSSSNNSSANSGVSIKVHSGDGYARAEAGHADQGSIFQPAPGAQGGGVRPGIGGGQVGQVHSIEIGGDGRSVQTQGASVQRYEGNGASDNAGVKFTSAKAGNPLSFHSAGPNDLVTIQGITTSKGAALAAGLIREEDFGNSSQGQQQQQPQPFQARGEQAAFDTKPVTNNPQEDIAAIDPNVQAANSERPVPLENAHDERALQHIAARVDPSDSFAAFRSAMTGSEMTDDLAAKIGNSLGINDLAQVRSHAKEVEKAFVQQATAEVRDPVLAWARSEKLSDLRAAAASQFSSGSLAGYNKLANTYYSNLDQIAPAEIINSVDGRRYNARQDKATGQVLLDLPGIGTMTFGAAMAAGIIGAHRGGRRGQRINAQIAKNSAKRK